MLDAGYGSRAAQNELNEYYNSILSDPHAVVDPIVLYVTYLMWKDGKSALKSDRLRAASALSSFRCFPKIAEIWLTADDSIDLQIEAEGLDKDTDEDIDEDYLDMSPDPTPSDPEYQWRIAKENHQVASPSMDKLMSLTGLADVKSRAVYVCKEVLLSKKRPQSIKAQVTMNFLFVGNPGTVSSRIHFPPSPLLCSQLIILTFSSSYPGIYLFSFRVKQQWQLFSQELWLN